MRVVSWDMAPPLLPLTRLVICSACAEHVKSTEQTCPHCGAVLGGRAGLLARAAGVALAGVVLSACNGKDGNSDGGTGSGTGTDGSESGTASDSSTGDPDTSGATGFETQAAYGVPTSDVSDSTVDPSVSTGATDGGTDSVGDTDTTATDGTTADTSGTGDSSDTGNSSMTGGPEYGVPDTTGNEPDYGVPGTGGEPDYGVPGTT
ncbi:MAG: zinc ribbon domain-containing protein [Nannocystis sp.]|nr:zinc ribbon domain-containing protein [Nannocystis sp.]MBA3546150.1 zinc ribbon domain-containing protein [Nannocystis sp.]